MDESSRSRGTAGRGRVWVALLLIVATLIAGAIAYNAGLQEGSARAAVALAAAQAQGGTQAPGVTPPTVVFPPPYGYSYWHRPWGFGFFFPLALLFFCFFALRAFAWGGPWRRHWGACGGPGYRFDEWHRQAHARMSDEPTRVNPGDPRNAGA